MEDYTHSPRNRVEEVGRCDVMMGWQRVDDDDPLFRLKREKRACRRRIRLLKVLCASPGSLSSCGDVAKAKDT